jgi:hypothetical protein
VVRPRRRSQGSLIQYRTGTDIRHSDCLYLENQPPYPNKWVASPRRCGDDVELSLHTIVGLSGKAAQAREEKNPTTDDFEFRHCRQISTNWKYARHRIYPYRPDLHSYDHLFAHSMARAFPDRAIFRQSGGPIGKLWDFLKQQF